jgi:D123
MAEISVSSGKLPCPTVDDILDCQLSNWYERFRNLPKDEYRRTRVTIKSAILQVPQHFIDYILSDGVNLPKGVNDVSTYISKASTDDDWGEDDADNDSDNSKEMFDLSELTESIQLKLDSLGGEIMPKLNWSSPKDASWINGGSLKCHTPGDVYILLKSSDFILHDILHAFDNARGERPSNFQYQLILRQWCNFNPSMEFRCFVWNRSVIAVSQRNHTQCFPHLQGQLYSIESNILDFFDDYVHDNFSESGNYCFDVYIDKNNLTWLIDFNVWGSQTDSLLFSWEELIEISLQSHVNICEIPTPQVRIVKTKNEVHHDPLASYRAPIDVVDLATASDPDILAFREFMTSGK